MPEISMSQLSGGESYEKPSPIHNESTYAQWLAYCTASVRLLPVKSLPVCMSMSGSNDPFKLRDQEAGGRGGHFVRIVVS